MEGRQYVGIDLSEEYCQFARQRVDQVAQELERSTLAPDVPSALEVKAMLENAPEPQAVQRNTGR